MSNDAKKQSEAINLKIIARMRSPFPTKYGIPRQSGIVDSIPSTIVFEPEYRVDEALRGIEGYSHLWIIWGFSENIRETWSPTVRPPRLGGNTRMGVFATRSSFRPNPLALSCVQIKDLEHTSEGTVIHVLGADLMDGTPIYDIKPYLSFTDAHPDARNGFAQSVKDHLLNVSLPENLASELPETAQTDLVRILSQDPRPAYHNDSDRIYGFPYDRWNIRFKVDADKLTVVEIQTLTESVIAENPIEDHENHENPIEDHEDHENPIEDHEDHENPIEDHEDPIENHENPIEDHENPIEDHENPIEDHEALEYADSSVHSSDTHQNTSIAIILSIGVALICIAGTAFVYATWNDLSDATKLLAIFGSAITFFAAFTLSHFKLALHTSAKAFYILGSSALSITLLAAEALDILPFNEGFGSYATFPVCLTLAMMFLGNRIYHTKLFKSLIYGLGFTLTFCIAYWLDETTSWEIPPYIIPSLMTAAALAILSIVSKKRLKFEHFCSEIASAICLGILIIASFQSSSKLYLTDIFTFFWAVFALSVFKTKTRLSQTLFALFGVFLSIIGISHFLPHGSEWLNYLLFFTILLTSSFWILWSTKSDVQKRFNPAQLIIFIVTLISLAFFTVEYHLQRSEKILLIIITVLSSAYYLIIAEKSSKRQTSCIWASTCLAVIPAIVANIDIIPGIFNHHFYAGEFDSEWQLYKISFFIICLVAGIAGSAYLEHQKRYGSEIVPAFALYLGLRNLFVYGFRDMETSTMIVLGSGLTALIMAGFAYYICRKHRGFSGLRVIWLLTGLEMLIVPEDPHHYIRLLGIILISLNMLQYLTDGGKSDSDRAWITTAIVLPMVAGSLRLMFKSSFIPEAVIPEVIALIWLIGAFGLSKWVWKESPKAHQIIIRTTFVAIVVAYLYSFFDQYTNPFGHVISFSTVAVASIIIGITKKQMIYTLAGSALIALIFFTQTSNFWASLSWWIYLLLLGIVLVTIAVANEAERRKGSSLLQKLRNKIQS